MITEAPAKKQEPQPEVKPNAWQLYEQRKAQLPDDLTASEYQEACKRIAEELGI